MVGGADPTGTEWSASPREPNTGDPCAQDDKELAAPGGTRAESEGSADRTRGLTARQALR